MALLLFIVILSVLVFVHEFGHFFAARRSKVKVEEFGFGFPPRLVGWKRNGMIWSLNAIPFGGFVRLYGENGEQRDDPSSFAAAPLIKRLLILAAGVIMNYLLAWVLWSVILTVGMPVAKDTAPTNHWAHVTQRAVEAFVAQGSAADQAGLHTGDTIVAVDGQSFTTTEQLIHHASTHQFSTLQVTIRRQHRDATITVTPRPDSLSGQPKYGFGILEVSTLKYPWYISPVYGLQTTLSLTGQTFQGFGQLVSHLITTGKVSEDLSGPVGIAVLTGQVSQLGIISVLQFIALLSISLAVINFLPLPALDGGRALFLVIEAIRRRPINIRIEQAFHAAGFYLLLLLIILISIRDVQRFNVFERISRIFGS